MNDFNLDILTLQETWISSDVRRQLRPISHRRTTLVNTFIVRLRHVVVAWHLFIVSLSSLTLFN